MVEEIAGRSAEPVGGAQTPGWSLCLWWVVASLLGWVIGASVGELVVFVAGLIAGAGIGALVLQIGVGVGSGFVIGVMQWLVLRRQVAGVGWWVVASAGGWVVFVAVVWLGFVGMRAIMVGAVGMVVGVVAGGAVGGFVVGVLQWLVLRRQVARASWWVAASVVGQVVFAVMVAFMNMFGFVGGLVGQAVGLAMYGGITGYVLVQLLRQRATGAGTPKSDPIAGPSGDRKDQSESGTKPPRWGFLLWWVVATIVGVAVGEVVSGFVGTAVDEVVSGALGEGVGWHWVGLRIVDGAVYGGVLGILQWLVLRRHMTGVGWWVMASVAGWGVARVMLSAGGLDAVDAVFGVVSGVVSEALVMRVVGVVFGVVDGVVYGLVVGVLQWLVLRRQMAETGRWVVASVVGWVGFGIVDQAVDWVGYGTVVQEVGEVVGPAMYGVITGIVLVQLLRQRAAGADEAVAASA